MCYRTSPQVSTNNTSISFSSYSYVTSKSKLYFSQHASLLLVLICSLLKQKQNLKPAQKHFMNPSSISSYFPLSWAISDACLHTRSTISWDRFKFYCLDLFYCALPLVLWLGLCNLPREASCSTLLFLYLDSYLAP